MATPVLSIVERVRDLLGDYDGDGITTLAAEASAAASSIRTASTEGIDAGAWLAIGYEMLRVTNVAEGPPIAISVIRGGRATTAAAHASGAAVLINPVWSSQRILDALNASLARMHKQVSDDESLSVVDGQYAYEIPAAIERLHRLEVETSEDGQYQPIREWDQPDSGHFRIYGDLPAGRKFNLVGVSAFSRMASGGSLDADFPDTNDAALAYLVYDAGGHLLLERNAIIGKRDSFVGVTDKDTPYDASRRLAQFYIGEALRLLRLAQGQEPVLQTPFSSIPDPSRHYLAAP